MTQIRLYCEFIFYRTGIWHGDGPEPAWDDKPKDIDIELDDLFAWELTLHRTEPEPEPVGSDESEAEGGGESATASVESESGGESEPEGGGELEPARETASAAIYCAVGREALDARHENIEPESGGESVARSKTANRETEMGISGPEFGAMFARFQRIRCDGGSELAYDEIWDHYECFPSCRDKNYAGTGEHLGENAMGESW